MSLSHLLFPVAALTAFHAQCDTANKSLCSARKIIFSVLFHPFFYLTLLLTPLCSPSESPGAYATLSRHGNLWSISQGFLGQRFLDGVWMNVFVNAGEMPSCYFPSWQPESCSLCFEEEKEIWSSDSGSISSNLKWTQWVQYPSIPYQLEK
jgi:hypothetical protein